MRIYIFSLLGLLALFTTSIMLTGFLVSRYFADYANQTITVSDTVVEISSGSSLKRVSQVLYDAKLINNKEQFYWYLRLGRRDGLKMQAGYYIFSGDMSFRMIADRLLHGTDPALRLVFKEGQTLNDLATLLSDMGLVTKTQFEEAMRSQEILELIKTPTTSRQFLQNDTGGIEGYLFPDTYYFGKTSTAHSIIKKMYQRLVAKLGPDIHARIAERKTSLHEVLTMASIIEKETGSKAEREIISSVYHNRLVKGMRLQADPTVIYGMKNYVGKISKADLLSFHPYNTYKIYGLPPGPISSVGYEAIRAALWPAETNFFYFVSKNDGSHIFCPDLACHNQAVRMWQIDYFKKAATK